jgi:iron complex outermembrane receptor protein
MKLVPGMSAVKVDGNVPTVSYHGTMARDDRRMLVLIDGRSVYKPGLARVVWNDLPVSVADVARIEVTRGPNSASYGANAFSGVINIITRHARDVSTTTVETRHGNNGVSDQRLTSGGDRGDASWRFTLEQQHDHGYDDGYDPDYKEDQLYRDNKTLNRANLRAGWDLSPRDQLEFFAGGSSTSLQRPPDDAFLEFTRYRDFPVQRNENAFAQLRWQRDFSPRHSLKVSAYSQYSDSREEMELCTWPATPALEQVRNGMESYLQDELQPAVGAVFFTKAMRDVYLQRGNIPDTIAALANPGVALERQVKKLNQSNLGTFCGDFAFDVVEKRHDLEIENTLHWGDRIKLVTGVNLRHDHAQSETYLSGTAENYSQRAFGTLEVEVADPVLVNLGGFWEKDDINGEFFNPRGALILKPAQGHSLRAVYSEAVRTSDLYEAEARTNLTADNLTPEFEQNRQKWLGWTTPHFFATQTSPGDLEAERIESRELGYYGRFGTLEVDVRFFEERLRNLLSRGVNPFTFNAQEREQVDLEGWETQLSWRPVPDHLLRVTNAHVHNEASVPLPYERGDFVIAHRRDLGDTRLRVEGRLQQYFEHEPVVFKENRYAERTHYQLSLALEF